MKITGDQGSFKKDRLGNTGKSEKGSAAYEKNAAASSPAKDAATPQAAQGASEKILLSDLGKEVAKIHDQIKKAPDTRAEKVQELKQKIDSGNYYVSSDKIAGKILEDIVKNG